jgi:hypothetical protein
MTALWKSAREIESRFVGVWSLWNKRGFTLRCFAGLQRIGVLHRVDADIHRLAG